MPDGGVGHQGRLVGEWVRLTHQLSKFWGCEASHEGPEVPSTRHCLGMATRPREERSLLVKRGHCEAAARAPLRILGPRVTAEAAKDAGDGHGDHKQHCHHTNHCRFHGPTRQLTDEQPGLRLGALAPHLNRALAGDRYLALPAAVPAVF